MASGSFKPGMVVHACNSSTQKAETGGSLGVQGQPELQSEFKTSLNCTARFCLKQQKEKKNHYV